MKSKLLLIAIIGFLCLFSPKSHAQTPGWLWTTGAGGGADDYENAIAVDDTGNIYVAGTFNSDTIFLGTDTLINAGFNDLFLAKYDSNGIVLWAKSFGGTGNDMASYVKVDGSGNIYLAGSFYSSLILFGSYPLTNVGAFDLFLAKFDTHGNVLWARSDGAPLSDVATSFAVDDSGNIYLAGTFENTTLTIGATTLTNASIGYNDIFLVKYNTSGNVVWAKSAGGKTYDYSTSVAAGDSGYIYLTGYFGSDTLIYGTDTLLSAGWWDVFLAKYDANGNVLWAKSTGGTSSDRATAVAVDTSGNIYLTGGYQSSSIVFGADMLTNAGGNDIFLAKYDTAGNVVWAKGVGEIGSDMANSLDLDISGNIYLAGGFESPTLTFGSTTLTNTYFNSDLFLAKYNSGGNVLWAKSAGGADSDFANFIATDESENIYVAGSFISSSIIIGSDTLTNSGNSDLFIIKSGFAAPVAGFMVSDTVICPHACIDFTDLSSGPPASWNWTFPGSSTVTSTSQNPSDICYASPGTFPVTLIVSNSKGSDTYQLNITVNTVDTSVTVSQETLSANATGTFQWYNCSTTALIPGQTNSSYTATENGSYAVIVTQAGCIDTSLCHVLTTVGIAEKSNDLSISVFPNPSGGEIKISVPEKATIEIFNANGQIIRTINSKELEIIIDLTGISRGIYLIKASMEKEIVTSKFVIE